MKNIFQVKQDLLNKGMEVLQDGQTIFVNLGPQNEGQNLDEIVAKNRQYVEQFKDTLEIDTHSIFWLKLKFKSKKGQA